ncbi:hypothetical protein OJAV_G00036340 [Oryzias javanicus]|uniref:Uncharacterized protein n=1 Tax=Oryzias javanicus TaxID=123683 RepID=A0A3S2MTI5_ORYJA|nr:hypothetical protein OJAV_G00036340 [Oryzias javanicus]
MSVRLREAEAQAELRETRQRMLELETQNQIHSNQLRRAEQESRCLQERVQALTAQNKDMHVQLQEIKRKQAEIECKSKEESWRFRKKREVQGQLNHTDSSQYIRDLKDQIKELKHEICCLKGQRGIPSQPTFDGIHIVNHYTGVDDAYRSSDDDGMEAPQPRSCTRIRLHPNLGDTDSEEDGEETLRLTVPQNNNNNHKSTTV